MTFRQFWDKLLKSNHLLDKSEKLSLSVAELKRLLGVAYEEGRLEGKVTGKAEAGAMPDFLSGLFGVKK